jgi:hypothetical protein
MYLDDSCAAATSAPSAMRTPWWFSYLQGGDVCNVATSPCTQPMDNVTKYVTGTSP